jgi:hypothetical protein
VQLVIKPLNNNLQFMVKQFAVYQPTARPRFKLASLLAQVDVLLFFEAPFLFSAIKQAHRKP